MPLDYQDEESGTPSYKSVPVRTLFQGREFHTQRQRALMT